MKENIGPYLFIVSIVLIIALNVWLAIEGKLWYGSHWFWFH